MKEPMKAVRRRRVGPAVWDPIRAAAGGRGYPKTPEVYEAMRAHGRAAAARINDIPIATRPTRAGIPNGWGVGGREKIAEATADAQEYSKEFVKVAKENGVLPAEDPRVERAFEVAVECLNAINEENDVPLHSMRDRLAAGRFLADFLKSRPASKVEATVTRPEDFLALLSKSE